MYDADCSVDDADGSVVDADGSVFDADGSVVDADVVKVEANSTFISETSVVWFFVFFLNLGQYINGIKRADDPVTLEIMSIITTTAVKT